jgi:hypothetical protein
MDELGEPDQRAAGRLTSAGIEEGFVLSLDLVQVSCLVRQRLEIAAGEVLGQKKIWAPSRT